MLHRNQAAVIWNDLSNSQKRNQAYRASFNLAVTWERDDDLGQANKTQAYLKILDKRIQFKAELDYQMTGK